MKKNNKIAVLGGGLWGTVLAQHLSRRGFPGRICLWEFFPEAAKALERTRRHSHIPGFRLAEPIAVGSDLDGAVADAGVLIFVLPSAVMRRTARAVRALWRADSPVAINASKGLEPSSLMTMGEVIASELPQARAVYTLSGPSFAREVARDIPTGLILAGPGGPGAKRLLRLLDGPALRVRWCADRRGVELGGSLKNALAIGCGILDALWPGAANAKAALITAGMAELGRLISACGGRAETVYGLSGLGDLIATGTSTESRNRAFGEKLGKGRAAQKALREIPTVVEGLSALGSARRLARRKGVQTPLLDAVWEVVRGGQPPRRLVRALGFD